MSGFLSVRPQNWVTVPPNAPFLLGAGTYFGSPEAPFNSNLETNIFQRRAEAGYYSPLAYPSSDAYPDAHYPLTFDAAQNEDGTYDLQHLVASTSWQSGSGSGDFINSWYSNDGGATWTDIPSLAYEMGYANGGDALYWGPTHTIYLATSYQGSETPTAFDHFQLWVSTDYGTTWSLLEDVGGYAGGVGPASSALTQDAIYVSLAGGGGGAGSLPPYGTHLHRYDIAAGTSTDIDLGIDFVAIRPRRTTRSTSSIITTTFHGSGSPIVYDDSANWVIWVDGTSFVKKQIAGATSNKPYVASEDDGEITVVLVSKPGVTGELWRSDDQGDTWTKVAEDDDLGGNLIHKDNDWFCSGRSNTVWVSHDRGVTWTSEPAAPSGYAVGELVG